VGWRACAFRVAAVLTYRAVVREGEAGSADQLAVFETAQLEAARAGPEVRLRGEQTAAARYSALIAEADLLESTCPQPSQYRIDIYAEGVWVGSAEGEREGVIEPYVQEGGPVAGFQLCRPADWEVVETPGAISTYSPDEEFELSVFVLAVPPELLEDPDLLTEAVIELLAEEEGVSDPGEPFEYPIGGQDGTYRYYVEDGAQVGIWASLGEDDVLRTLVSRAPPEETELLDDLELDVEFQARPT